MISRTRFDPESTATRFALTPLLADGVGEPGRGGRRGVEGAQLLVPLFR
ncbi:hypothetical protein ACFCYB_16045 [Streptomyces sp. NPDC056309]